MAGSARALHAQVFLFLDARASVRELTAWSIMGDLIPILGLALRGMAPDSHMIASDGAAWWRRVLFAHVYPGSLCFADEGDVVQRVALP